MSIALQSCIGSSTGSTATATFGSNVTAGSTIVVCAIQFTTGKTFTIHDGETNTYSTILGPTNGSSSTLQSWICTSAIGGTTNTVTVVSAGGFIIIVALEYAASLGITGVLDKSSVATGSSTALNSGATATTGTATDLLIVYGGSQANDGTFTQAGSYAIEKSGAITSECCFAVADQQVSSTGAYTGTITQSRNQTWACIIIALVLNAGPLTQSFAAATASFSATLNRQTNHTLSAATASFAATLARKTLVALNAATSAFAAALKKSTAVALSAATAAFAATLAGKRILIVQFNAATAAFAAALNKKTFMSLPAATAAFAAAVQESAAVGKTLLAALAQFAATLTGTRIGFTPDYNQRLMLSIIAKVQAQGIHISSSTLISTVCTFREGRGFNFPWIEAYDIGTVTNDWLALEASGLVPPNIVTND